MLQVKTVADIAANGFDDRVNKAIAEGWQLVKRYYTPDGYFVAELERDEITEAERCCENCAYWEVQPESAPCRSCEDGTNGYPTKWEPVT